MSITRQKSLLEQAIQANAGGVAPEVRNQLSVPSKAELTAVSNNLATVTNDLNTIESIVADISGGSGSGFNPFVSPIIYDEFLSSQSASLQASGFIKSALSSGTSYIRDAASGDNSNKEFGVLRIDGTGAYSGVATYLNKVIYWDTSLPIIRMTAKFSIQATETTVIRMGLIDGISNVLPADSGGVLIRWDSDDSTYYFYCEDNAGGEVLSTPYAVTQGNIYTVVLTMDPNVGTSANLYNENGTLLTSKDGYGPYPAYPYYPVFQAFLSGDAVSSSDVADLDYLSFEILNGRTALV